MEGGATDDRVVEELDDELSSNKPAGNTDESVDGADVGCTDDVVAAGTDDGAAAGGDK